MGQLLWESLATAVPACVGKTRDLSCRFHQSPTRRLELPHVTCNDHNNDLWLLGFSLFRCIFSASATCCSNWGKRFLILTHCIKLSHFNVSMHIETCQLWCYFPKLMHWPRFTTLWAFADAVQWGCLCDVIAFSGLKCRDIFITFRWCIMQYCVVRFCHISYICCLWTVPKSDLPVLVMSVTRCAEVNCFSICGWSHTRMTYKHLLLLPLVICIMCVLWFRILECQFIHCIGT